MNEDATNKAGRDPTWTELIPTLVLVASRAPDKGARELAMRQLLTLGEIVDRHIVNLKALEASLPEPTAAADEACPDCGVRRGHAFGCELARKEAA